MKRAFTYIELLLVIAIIGLIANLSGGISSRFLIKNEVNNTSDLLTSTLRKAQNYAMAGKQNSNWGVAYSANTITLYKGTDYINRDTTFDEIISVNPQVTVSGLTDINFARVSGLPTVITPP